MKKLNLILAVALPLLFTQCKEDKVQPDPLQEQGCFPQQPNAEMQADAIAIAVQKNQFELQQGQTAQPYENGPSVKLLEISDNRCPADVVCIQYGKAQVSLLLDDQQSLNLCVGDCGNGIRSEDVTTFTYGSETYKLYLLEVMPYPVDSQPAPVKSAILRLEKQ